MSRDIKYLVVHHSASGLHTTIDDIRRWHVEEREFADIGYNWVIEGDGALRYGRSVYLMGAHTKGYNRVSLGVCLVGDNTNVNRKWNKKQVQTLKSLIGAVELVFSGIQVVGHRDLVETTVCPGVDVRELL